MKTTLFFITITFLLFHLACGQTKPEILPGATPEVSATDATYSDGIKITWKAVPGATYYRIYRASSSISPFHNIASTTSNSYFDKVVSGVTYFYKIKACNKSMGCGSFSSPSEKGSTSEGILKLWLKADAISGLANGTPIGMWLDSSGSGNYVIQGTSNKQPIYMEKMINDKPAVRFDGVDDYMETVKGIIDRDDISIFVVARHHNTSDNFVQCIIGHGKKGDNEEENGIFSLYIQNNLLTWFHEYNKGTNHYIPNTDNFISHDWLILGGIRKTTTRDITFLINGRNQIKPYYNNTTGGDMGRVYIGSWAGIEEYFSGDIAEIRVYDAALSDNARKKVECELSMKYGIDIGGCN